MYRFSRLLLLIIVGVFFISQPLTVFGGVSGGEDPAPGAPGTPSSASAPLTNSTSVTWSWSAASDVEGGAGSFSLPVNSLGDFSTHSVSDYEICIGSAAGQCDVTGTPVSTGGSLSYTRTGLSNGYTYYAKVRAKDNVGQYGSYSSNSAGVTVDTAAPTFSGLAATNITTNSAVVGWDTNEAATTQVKYGTSSGSYPSTSSLNSSLSTGHVVTLSGLSAGTKYYFQAMSRDAAGNLGTSSEGSFTTTSSGSTSTPTSTSTSTPTSTSTSTPTSTTTTNPTDSPSPTETSTETPTETPSDGGVTETPSQTSSTVLQTSKDPVPQDSAFQGVSARALSVFAPVTAGVALVSLIGLFGPTISIVTWLTSLFAVILIFLNTLLEWIGLRRRRYPWGVVFNAETNAPMDLAIVRLRTEAGKLVETRVTDRFGRFGFLALPGRYTIDVIKAGFEVVSSRQVTKTPYEPIYDGKVFEVAANNAAVIMNVAMLPHERRHGFALSRFVPSFRRVLMFLTLALGIVTYVEQPLPIVAVIIGLSLFILVAEMLVLQPRGFGVVRDAHGRPLANLALRLTSATNDRLVASVTTNAKGHYAILVRPGSYRLSIADAQVSGPDWMEEGKKFEITNRTGGLIAPSFRTE